ncbi:MAG: hypothetical protein A2139_08090 [Desulfobacca sp. RBG_16_60_12]|nr:MAG: hypothetical protein A2139_08090 [Desulfobacca sp. RBG_16_60_12]
MEHARGGIGHPDDDHAQVQQRRHHGEAGGLLAAVGGGGGDHDPRRLAFQGPGEPQVDGAIDVLLHLGAHVAETGGGAEDDAVGRLQIIHRRNADIPLLGQYFLGVFAALEFGEVGIQFLDPAQDHFRPCHRLCPCGRGPGQLQHVAVHGVIDYQDFHDRFSPLPMS